MATDYDTLDQTDDGRPKPKRNKDHRTEFLGELHRELTRGLPDFVDHTGVLDTLKLSKQLNCSRTAIYHWLKTNMISRTRVEQMVALSESSLMTPDPVDNVPWVPLTKDEMWKFLSK